MDKDLVMMQPIGILDYGDVYVIQGDVEESYERAIAKEKKRESQDEFFVTF